MSVPRPNPPAISAPPVGIVRTAFHPSSVESNIPPAIDQLVKPDIKTENGHHLVQSSPPGWEKKDEEKEEEESEEEENHQLAPPTGFQVFISFAAFFIRY